jgi:hypothetical protein
MPVLIAHITIAIKLLAAPPVAGVGKRFLAMLYPDSV